MKHFVLAAAALALAAPPLLSQTTVTPEPKGEVRIVRINGGSFLGVNVSEVNADNAKTLGLREEYGSLITKVLDSTGAMEAGLLANDVVIGWNGTRVESSMALRRMVRETPVGRTVRLTIVRNGQQMDVPAKIGERNSTFELPELPQIPDLPGVPDVPMAPPKFEWRSTEGNGAHLAAISRELELISSRANGPRIGVTITQTEIHGTEEQQNDFAGVRIMEVVDGLGAQEAGLKPGDRIATVEGKPVDNLSDVVNFIQQAGKDPNVTHVNIGYERDGVTTTVPVRLDRSARSAPAHREHQIRIERQLEREMESAPHTTPDEPKLGCQPKEAPGLSMRVIEVPDVQFFGAGYAQHPEAAEKLPDLPL